MNQRNEYGQQASPHIDTKMGRGEKMFSFPCDENAHNSFPIHLQPWELWSLCCTLHPGTYLSPNWQFVTFDHLLFIELLAHIFPFCPSPCQHLGWFQWPCKACWSMTSLRTLFSTPSQPSTHPEGSTLHLVITPKLFPFKWPTQACRPLSFQLTSSNTSITTVLSLLRHL